MRILVETILAPATVESAWALYSKAFNELRTEAVQRHVMYRDEFDQLMADERVLKFRPVDDTAPGHVPALATFTNDLTAVPLISPHYFAHRWPELFDQHRIWYNPFFAIAPEQRSSGIFEQVITAMWERVLDSDGIAALDICRRNDLIGLSAAITGVLRSVTPGTRATAIDEQTYWLFEPAPGSRT
jgi:hypothetical protein